MSFDKAFIGKKIIVTGAGRGIGREIATKLYNYGATVFALSKNPMNLASLKLECPGIETIVVDLCDWNETRYAVKRIGLVDGLVNNAGVPGVDNFMDITPEKFDHVINIHLKAVINVSQVVARGMMDAKSEGSIVNMSSVAAKCSFPFETPYCVSKAGLDVLSKNMAVELGPHNIRVNSVNPGGTGKNGIPTDMVQRSMESLQKMLGPSYNRFSGEVERRICLPDKLIDTEEVANATLFLLSDLSSKITGQCLVIDGGYSAH